ncbi:dolichyl-diphosphooligosaccharide--protein glycosyltransferase subunit 1, putative [Plasmodium gaboni]|uniref:Dolichyl-diphosphooligosaccharide--protein glycosyltransferase subunit 1 n=2 Tax=Plasmodium gaboni TaxID=647221 RepID=A0ABY1UI30_9APIC|nr:dolichyl-diphosphooligosaccharide--protein glycosyltransferase subunit 1, putative [Plasmodium gaboni]
MKIIYIIFITFVFIIYVYGKLNIDIFKNLVNIDIEYINFYKNDIRKKYMRNGNSLIYEHVSKYINLKNNYVEVIIKGELKNVQDTLEESFLFLLPYHEAYQATNLHVVDEKGNILQHNILKDTIDIEEINIDSFNHDVDISNFNIKVYEILLNTKLKLEEHVVIELSYTLGQPYHPYPLDINLMEKQNVLFYLSSKILLPYQVEKYEQIDIKLCDNCDIVNLDDACFLKDLKKINDKNYIIKYQHNIEPFNLGDKILLYFVCDYNLGYFEKVIKNINISSLGYIYEKEEYFLKNNAAKINKFDRYVLSDYESKYTSSAGATTGNINGATNMGFINIENKNDTFNNISNINISNVNISKTNMPTDKTHNQNSIIYSLESKINYNIYDYNYFDDLGKIYLIRGEEIYDDEKKKNILKFDVKPRYPLLGGWKFHFFNTFYHYSNLYKMKNKRNAYAYKVDISPTIKSFYIKQLNINISLPSYSHDIFINKDNLKNNLHIQTTKKKEWIDFFSERNVLELQIHKFFPSSDEKYMNNFLVTYNLPMTHIFIKPLILIIITFFIILLIFIMKKISFNFNTVNENEIEKEKIQQQLFHEKSKELYENLSYISDKLIQSVNCLNGKEKKENSEILTQLEEKWTYDFIIYTKEFYRLFEYSDKKYELQEYVDKCFNYHAVVKQFFEAQKSNNLNVNLNEIAKAEKDLLLLLKYN